mmetsp:Transcript_8828/g.25679  ORF Transcript_8828/g.25679 Transcript_8828/m.25679 type:complete len:88 (+) Transcript_8828:389-652(+)
MCAAHLNTAVQRANAAATKRAQCIAALTHAVQELLTGMQEVLKPQGRPSHKMEDAAGTTRRVRAAERWVEMELTARRLWAACPRGEG